MKIFIRRYHFYSSVHSADIRSEGNSVETKVEQIIDEKGVYSWTNQKEIINDTPEEDFAEASNTALIFVVALDSLRTACIGK